ncbi:MAG: TrmB family transcriptional regulator [Methanobrevibacter sp.]|jgi:sugar-specific transcriptional regulator TrmB|nr:TrmB family transcriptional regulator [Candidatus Methanovirga aequatorialis]
MNEVDKKILKSLKHFGLTEYEASTYLTLNYMISGTATEISENSKVPRSKIYEILKFLDKKGFVEIEKGRPLKYSVVPPMKIFRINKNRIIKELEENEKNLNEIYENQLSKVPAPVWLIHGEDKIIEKEIDLISKAKKTIVIRIGFLFEDEWEKLESKINQKVKKGVDVKIMVREAFNVKNRKIKSEELLKNSKAKISKSNLPTAKMIIKDEKEMMHIFTKFNNQKPDPETAIGIWNKYEDIAKNYHDRFEISWNKKVKNKL